MPIFRGALNTESKELIRIYGVIYNVRRDWPEKNTYVHVFIYSRVYLLPMYL